MSKIALVPIDNRPVCYTLPKMIIAQDNQHSILLPDINLMGDLHSGAKIDSILDWLNSLDNIDFFIISLDTLVYGGLIPSRTCNDNINSLYNRINNIFRILKKYNSKIYAHSSIMRISNNNINEEEKIYWKDWGKKIFDYSFNYHKLGNVKTDIPQDILTDYINTRKRNFEINKYYIELKKQGLIDTLVFSKDDCAQFGINVAEANELKKLSKEIDNIFIKTGADEIPLNLISRSINKYKKIKIYPFFLQPDSINKISKYEDISVKQSVENQIEISGALVSDEKNCDMVLIVNNFKDEQGELVMGVNTALFDKNLILPNKPYCIADIVNANGSDNNFVERLLNKELKNFYAYAAWNTTGNTLGSVLSSALTFYKAKQPDINAFNELQVLRFLDDWAYQANVRAQIRSDKLNLKPSLLTKKLEPYFKILKSKFPINKTFSCHFPWNRFFEIEIKFKKNTSN